MSLEIKSQELKDIVATYDTQWFLGDLAFLISSGKERANDQLGSLSSPLRQLYYLSGLNVSSDPSNGSDYIYSPEKWNKIVVLLNDIESEYQKLFFPEKPEDVTEEWKRVREVAMPSFLSYFNQGPLNFEEQVINWTRDLYTSLDKIIEIATGLKTENFITFYENLDKLHQINFQSHTTNKDKLRPNWEKYTKIKMGVLDEAPDFIKEMGEQKKHFYTFMSDKGIISRFYPQEIVSDDLPLDKVCAILKLLSVSRAKIDFLYYTATKPGNPLYEKPILALEDGMYQVFEVKQVIHAIENLLEQFCISKEENKTKYVEKKGNLLEDRIVELFSKFFKNDFKLFRSYYVDGCEQDILILWKKFAFIIEAKGYSLHEPFRNPEKAFKRIKDDFNACIGYGYTQTRRIEKKFIDGVPFNITDKNGNLIEKIDTTLYEEDFSIIVNLKSFGQVQCDLSTLIKLENDDDVFPWAVKLDDLEIFLLTLIAQGKSPMDFATFLLMRETLHEKLVCSDELEVCGGFLAGKLKQKQIEKASMILTTHDLGDIFDEQYRKTMGFKNEKYLYEKQSGKFLFW
ncbi:hypothetical protein [Aquirufa nivalisilvae]